MYPVYAPFHSIFYPTAESFNPNTSLPCLIFSWESQSLSLLKKFLCKVWSCVIFCHSFTCLLYSSPRVLNSSYGSRIVNLPIFISLRGRILLPDSWPSLHKVLLNLAVFICLPRLTKPFPFEEGCLASTWVRYLSTGLSWKWVVCMKQASQTFFCRRNEKILIKLKTNETCNGMFPMHQFPRAVSVLPCDCV